jgi:DNA-binding response OmpR family regulator
MAKVLIIESNPASLYLYKELLEKTGYEVIMSTDAEIIDTIQREQPNLLVMNSKLSSKSGISLYNEIKTRVINKIPPVILISSELNITEITNLTGIPRDRCLIRPFDFREFLFKIESLCKQKKVALSYGT